MKKLIYELLALAAAMLTTVALFADVESTGNLSMALNGDGIPQLIAFAAMLSVYRKWIVKKAFIQRTSRRDKICGAVIALMFTAFMIIGKAQIAEPDLKYELFAVLLFFGYMPLFYLAAVFLMQTIDTHSKTQTAAKSGSVTEWLFEKHVTAGVMLVVFLCRLP